MNTLTQAERERLTNYLNSAHTEVLQIIKPLSDPQLEFKNNQRCGRFQRLWSTEL